jgi:hypothetical protein
MHWTANLDPSVTRLRDDAGGVVSHSSIHVTGTLSRKIYSSIVKELGFYRRNQKLLEPTQRSYKEPHNSNWSGKYAEGLAW